MFRASVRMLNYSERPNLDPKNFVRNRDSAQKIIQQQTQNKLNTLNTNNKQVFENIKKTLQTTKKE